MSDLFAPHQLGTIERIADERVAARLAQVFAGVNERFAEAVAAGVKQALAGEIVSVPVFHLADIVAEQTPASSGKKFHVSGAVRT